MLDADDNGRDRQNEWVETISILNKGVHKKVIKIFSMFKTKKVIIFTQLRKQKKLQIFGQIKALCCGLKSENYYNKKLIKPVES